MTELDIERERREFEAWYIDPDRTGSTFGYQGTPEGIHAAFKERSYVAWLAAKRAVQCSAEPVAFAFVIVDKNGNPEFVTSTHDEAQAHINDAISEHHIHGAGKWRSIPAYEMRPSDDKLWDQALRERDYNAEVADKLAEAIAQYFSEEIGEHSNANCPWLEALRVIEEAAPPAPVSADVDTAAFVASEKIMEICAEKLQAGRASQRQAQIQCVVIDAIRSAPVSAEPVNAAMHDGIRQALGWTIPDQVRKILETALYASVPLSTDAKDSERLDWLQENFYSRQLEDFEKRIQKLDCWSWMFYAPKDVQGDIREVIDAAIAAKGAGK